MTEHNPSEGDIVERLMQDRLLNPDYATRREAAAEITRLRELLRISLGADRGGLSRSQAPFTRARAEGIAQRQEDKGMSDQLYLREGIGFAAGRAVEETGEFLSALGKTMRWGRDSYNPELPPDQRETNEAWLRREMQDVREALDNLEAEMNKPRKFNDDMRFRP